MNAWRLVVTDRLRWEAQIHCFAELYQETLNAIAEVIRKKIIPIETYLKVADAGLDLFGESLRIKVLNVDELSAIAVEEQQSHLFKSQRSVAVKTSQP